MNTLTILLTAAVLAVGTPTVLLAQSSMQAIMDFAEGIAANTYKEREIPSDWPVHFISDTAVSNTWAHHPYAVDGLGPQGKIILAGPKEWAIANTYKEQGVLLDHFISDTGESDVWSYHPSAVDPYTFDTQGKILPTNPPGWTIANTYKGREVPSDWPVHFISDTGKISKYQLLMQNQPAYMPICTVPRTDFVYAVIPGIGCGTNPLARPGSM